LSPFEAQWSGTVIGAGIPGSLPSLVLGSAETAYLAISPMELFRILQQNLAKKLHMGVPIHFHSSTTARRPVGSHTSTPISLRS